MKHYDPSKVEALLDQMDANGGCGYLIHSLADAVRSSAREVEEPSDDEITDWLARYLKLRDNGVPMGYRCAIERQMIRAALARFGQQGAGAEAARRYSEGKISAGKFGELLGLEPGELHDFKTACGAFDEKRHMELLGQPRGRVVEGWAQVAPSGEVLRIALDEWGSTSPLPEAYGEQRRIRIEILDAQGEEEKK